MAVALIVAAGRGERLGSDRPKALVSLAGHPMLEWSVETLRGIAAVHRIVVALPADALDCAPVGTTGVTGGEARSQSVRAALEAAGEGDPVIVHDAARPLAPAELFERLLVELESSSADAVIAATPVSDTIKEVANDRRTVRRTLERSLLWAVQTPQVFRRRALERALSEVSEEVLKHATDDAWLIEHLGGTVHVLDAGARNIKITTATDLRLAEMLLGEMLLGGMLPGEKKPLGLNDEIGSGQRQRTGRKLMHSVVVHATINDREVATRALHETVVPQVKQAPGFVAGYWNAVGPGKGVSVVVFESEDQARAAAEQLQPPGDFVSFDSVDVAEVVAHA